MDKVDLNKVEYVYLIGIGGIGMSALARYFKLNNKEVAGYDRTSSPLIRELQAEKINIHFVDTVSKIPSTFKEASDKAPETLLIIYTPAIPKNHTELNFWRNKGANILKRSAVLGLITDVHKTIAIAGTHGKTTISTLVAHILTSSGYNCTAFLGGISQNYHTNFISGNATSNNHYVVVEADEYDRSFLTLKPHVGLISSIDADHLDIYGDQEQMQNAFKEFCGNTISNKGSLILNKKTSETLKQKSTTQTYALHSPADHYAENIIVNNGNYQFDICTTNGKLNSLIAGMPGRHNLENAIAATAVCKNVGVTDQDISKAIATFKGVKRRFEYHIKNKKHIYMDDYAHHPNELIACINSVKEMYPDKKITGIFQPHLYSRTRDFAIEFGKALSLLDTVLLLDIYPARELPIEGVSSKIIFDEIGNNKKEMCDKEEVIDWVIKHKPEVLLTLGAGDIDQLIEPIKNAIATFQ